jgi:hypothetical protein
MLTPFGGLRRGRLSRGLSGPPSGASGAAAYLGFIVEDIPGSSGESTRILSIYYYYSCYILLCII